MTRKDFILIAATIETHAVANDLTTEEHGRLATSFANACETTNERFDRRRFLEAAMGSNELPAAEELADEFIENGMNDVAEYLRQNGPAATRWYIAAEIAENPDDDHNLQVAQDAINGLLYG